MGRRGERTRVLEHRPSRPSRKPTTVVGDVPAHVDDRAATPYEQTLCARRGLLGLGDLRARLNQLAARLRSVGFEDEARCLRQLAARGRHLPFDEAAASLGLKLERIEPHLVTADAIDWSTRVLAQAIGAAGPTPLQICARIADLLALPETRGTTLLRDRLTNWRASWSGTAYPEPGVRRALAAALEDGAELAQELAELLDHERRTGDVRCPR